jgi:hypothetical protein
LPHFVLPESLWNVPAKQLTQTDFPVESWYLPGTHDEQSVEPDSDWNLPTAQLSQGHLPVRDWNLPTPHTEQLIDSAID